MRTLILTAVAILGCLTPCLAMNQQDLERTLRSTEVLRADYRQTRYVDGLEVPLESAGRVLLAREVGVVWLQTEPFRAEHVITDETIVVKAPGQPRRLLYRSEQGEIFGLVSLITSFLEGDRTALEQAFATSFENQGDGRWSVVLSPRNSRLKKLFASITVQGDALIERLEIHEKSGNMTVIEFFDQSTEPATLSSDEIRYFE